ncbi:MAG: sigma-70 family RNA polymerase sigma factor [Mediterranea sp.]|jgi:RNA polymerase sigma-70 factor (ECF subfamily)|nr:sigma-70 family RNA polymerase sigma factor [Mediterranea sp.]
MKPQDENLYIKRILDGETELFAHFLDRYSRPVYSLVIQMVSSPEDTEELVQDIFLKAFRALDKFRGNSSFSTWLYRIAYNQAISAARKQKNEYSCMDENAIRHIPDEEAEQFLCLSDNEERILQLAQAIDRLSVEEKALVTLFYYEDKTIDELAIILGLSQANVKVRLHRIRKKLYALMKGESYGRKK